MEFFPNALDSVSLVVMGITKSKKVVSEKKCCIEFSVKQKDILSTLIFYHSGWFILSDQKYEKSVLN